MYLCIVKQSGMNQHFAYSISSSFSFFADIHTFSAKEKDTETGLSYFGSRYYSSDLSIWLSVDPMSDKYPSLSPYVYCANNPIKLVDPNGMQWETPEDELRSQSMIKKAESNIEANKHKINVILNKGEFKEKDKRKLDDLIHQNEYLSEGIANLKDMGLSTEETYHFSDRENIDQGGVQKRQDGVIDIIQSGDAMAWHECVHIGDYRKNLNWNFNKNGFLGTSKDNYASSEYKAYESQFSFDNNSLKYTNGAVVDKLSNVKRWVDFHGYNIK